LIAGHGNQLAIEYGVTDSYSQGIHFVGGVDFSLLPTDELLKLTNRATVIHAHVGTDDVNYLVCLPMYAKKNSHNTEVNTI